MTLTSLRLLLFTWLSLVLLPAVSADELTPPPLIRASVSPEFPNGLHAKYLRYLAAKLDMKLDIIPMPFGRRLKELEKGKLDLAVGLQRRSDSTDYVVYLFPAYEALRHSFFVPVNRDFVLNRFEDLHKLRIGVTTHAKYYTFLLEPQNLTKVGVATLKQKIQLLQKGRIDTFIHFQESTLPTLEKLKLDDEIELAPFQPVEYKRYYVAISRHSFLMQHKSQLEKIVEAGVKNGDFARIRQQHYQQLELANRAKVTSAHSAGSASVPQ